jgi:hypothetical protein
VQSVDLAPNDSRVNVETCELQEIGRHDRLKGVTESHLQTEKTDWFPLNIITRHESIPKGMSFDFRQKNNLKQHPGINYQIKSARNQNAIIQTK